MLTTKQVQIYMSDFICTNTIQYRENYCKTYSESLPPRWAMIFSEAPRAERLLSAGGTGALPKPGKVGSYITCSYARTERNVPRALINAQPNTSMNIELIAV